MYFHKRKFVTAFPRLLWVGSRTSWNPLKSYTFVSHKRHAEPFAKRREGNLRRAARHWRLQDKTRELRQAWAKDKMDNFEYYYDEQHYTNAPSYNWRKPKGTSR